MKKKGVIPNRTRGLRDLLELVEGQSSLLASRERVSILHLLGEGFQARLGRGVGRVELDYK